jgi:PAS domain S-box-containing protein
MPEKPSQEELEQRLAALEIQNRRLRDAHDELVKKLNFTQSLLSAIPTPVFYKDMQTRYLGCNEAFTEVMGVSHEQIQGKTVYDIWPRDKAKIHHQKDLELLASSRRQIYEFEVKDRQGRIQPVICCKDVFQDETGEIAGLVGGFIDITEVREAQKEMLRRRRFLESVLYHVPDAIITLDEQHRVLDWNPGAVKIFGYTPEEAMGCQLDDLVARQPHHSEARAKTAHILAGQRLEAFETIRYRKDGTPINVIAAGSPVMIEGELKGVVAVYKDITDRVQAEEALRESECKYRLLADNVRDVIWTLNMNLDYTYISPSIEKLRGCTPEEAVQLPLGKTFTPESYRAVIDKFSEEAAREGRPGVRPDRCAVLELDMICVDGNLRQVEVNASFIRDEGGSPTGIIGITRDISDRKKAEIALKESEERFRALHNASFGGIAIHDKGIILECNKGLSEMTGHEYGELIGMDGLLLISEDTRDRVTQNINADYEKPYEAKGVRKNGEMYPMRLEARVIPYKGKNVRVVEFRDLTESKRAEQEKENLEAQLRQAQKLEAVGRLAGGVAHDFNNMLSVILGYAGLALEDVNPAQPLYNNLKEIKNAGERSAELTRQLLTFARKQTIAPKVLNLNKTVQGMINMLQRLIGENIDLTWLPGEDIWPVKVDPSQIDQILANLCVNARDAIGKVGKVIIETGNIRIDKAFCSDHTEFSPGEYVQLAVSDNGRGMDTETLGKIFEPFFTTKQSGQGTGLGLATVYGVVRQNNGFINVYSEPGQGTVFKIYLPRHLTQKIPMIERGGERPQKLGHETILLVEDEPAILKITTMMLQKLGYQVMPARTPGEAIRLSEAYADEIHLLMTDVVMPEMNGRDLARNILSSYPNIKRLFMSGYTANVIAHHGVLDEGVNFIQKPFSIKDLGVKVRDALDSP